MLDKKNFRTNSNLFKAGLIEILRDFLTLFAQKKLQKN